MPKRACPFDDDLHPQLKVHVSDKQVDTGVYRDERMKKVYDKTLNMLKDGSRMLAQKLNPPIEIHTANLLSPKLSPYKMLKYKNLKQMVLNGRLQIETTKKLTEKVQTDLCGCCRVIDKNVAMKCHYCDQVLCSFCLSECVKCLETFCQNCYFTVFDREERNICLTCYP